MVKASTNPSELVNKPVYAILALGLDSCMLLFPEIVFRNVLKNKPRGS